MTLSPVFSTSRFSADGGAPASPYIMKNTIRLLLLAWCLCGAGLSLPASAQTGFDFENIDTLLEDNMLDDTANRYASVMLSFFPERATRLGFASANSKLDDRSPRTAAQALSALRAVRENLEEVSPAQLSAAKRADRALLESALNADIWDLEQNRIENDPLYYAEAFDSVYDILLKQTSSAAKQRADLAARVNALPLTAAQAERNLVQPPTFLSQQAMEKAYYAYLAFDEVTEFLLAGAEDEISAAQVKRESQTAKRAIKRMFELFKRLSQEKDTQDFRLGEEKYARVLADRYQIDEKPAKLVKRLEKNFRTAQENLAAALEPFTLETAEEEITVVDDLNAQPTVQALPQDKKKKAKKGKFVPPSAQEFYTAARRLATAPAQTDLIAGLTQDANGLAAFFEQDGTLPAKKVSFSVKPMPAYYAYTLAYLFVPPYGNQISPSTDFFLRLPAGNQLAKEEQLKRDFNAPTRKLLLSGELVPGRYYQTLAGANLSSPRRLYPSAATANGWSAYAQRLAKERGYIVTDEELLFLAWTEYRRAAAALADARLHSKKYSYTDAINFLVAENGFNQEEAESLLKGVSARPGEAVSFITGLEAVENVRAKYAKKLGKKFVPAQFHAMLLQAGNVPPAELEKEVARLYEKAERQAKQKSLF